MSVSEHLKVSEGRLVPKVTGDYLATHEALRKTVLTYKILLDRLEGDIIVCHRCGTEPEAVAERDGVWLCARCLEEAR